MAPIGILDLATARMLRNPLGLLIFVAALGLGPGLHLIGSASPVLDSGAQAALPWLRVLAVAAASLAAWSLTSHKPLRRRASSRAKHAEDALVLGMTTLSLLAVGAGSLALAGFELELASLVFAPLKLAALGALALTCTPSRSRWAVGLLWALPLAAPQFLPAPLAQLVGVPLAPALLPQTLSILGLLLIGQSLCNQPPPTPQLPEA